MKAIEEAVRSDAPATRVVVVEDDQASADVLQRRLQANGMVVSVAHDGKRGIELVEELRRDIPTVRDRVDRQANIRQPFPHLLRIEAGAG